MFGKLTLLFGLLRYERLQLRTCVSYMHIATKLCTAPETREALNVTRPGTAADVFISLL